jgi:hypothetical protein
MQGGAAQMYGRRVIVMGLRGAITQETRTTSRDSDETNTEVGPLERLCNVYHANCSFFGT